ARSLTLRELELGIRIYYSDLVDHLDRGRRLDWHDHVGALHVFKIVGSNSGCRQGGRTDRHRSRSAIR
ncbi:MAG TPA: hypothetical protein VFO40_12230, partial [Chthoniobacterales bacterium]|nr:hypothetical protein [Chthoniobacterales bacterium]